MSNISHDSGVDEPAPTPVPQVPPTTRLSWFLAEVDEGLLVNDSPNGKIRLCVLHSMELIEAEIADKYLTRIVEFRVNGKTIEARLLLATDDRRVVDSALVAMSREQRYAEEDCPHIIVQYMEKNPTGNRLIQKMTTPLTVVWMSSRPQTAGTPVVKVSPGCMGHVLYAYERRANIEKVLIYLKSRCFDIAFDAELDPTKTIMDEHTWMLVQYSPEPEMVAYQVISYSQTIWRQENQFKDVIAYIQLPGTESVLQAVVICYSQDEQKMEDQLEKIRSFGLEMDFPESDDVDQQILKGSGTVAIFARYNSTLFQKAEQRDNTGEQRGLRRALEEMTVVAQTEATKIIEAFNVVDNINRNLRNRIEGLKAAASAIEEIP